MAIPPGGRLIDGRLALATGTEMALFLLAPMPWSSHLYDLRRATPIEGLGAAIG